MTPEELRNDMLYHMASILLNEGVLDALDWPRQVQILINKEEKIKTKVPCC